ncbi:ABC-2 type transporter [Desulfofarcimen acetoxidans DSM 771]|uniref:Transport permease protein n=1 Tax=Desulfofarcimen acetoxidans (strain ATCC 49208 / DSM 771 / KCTC 5769 / VKM B-1644 / 5575) TaxID=485916 RepID=C8VW95_DESAS|nr:ABC transporter permease [Desulfofarcimen acetoxidans]ACV62447.1 ABC-2 type transporter [Desulfofarcimen acetoxidans DSM 771]
MIIKPKKGWQLIDIKELCNYKELFYFLVAKEIKIRYKQTVLGGLWAVIQPFLSMVIFTLFLGKFAKMPSDGVPYPIFNFSALIAWNYFASTVTRSGSSLIGNVKLISRVYFPRLIIPLAPSVAGLMDFFIAFLVLIGLMFYFHIYPTVMILYLPLLVLLIILSASGVGLFLASLSIKYRDIPTITPFLLQLWMFASPIVYPTSMIPAEYRLIYALNPMAGILEGFRSALLKTVPFPWHMILISAITSIILFIFGLIYFQQVERFFADII